MRKFLNKDNNSSSECLEVALVSLAQELNLLFYFINLSLNDRQWISFSIPPFFKYSL